MKSTNSVYEKQILHRSPFHPSALLAATAGEPHIPVAAPQQYLHRSKSSLEADAPTECKTQDRDFFHLFFWPNLWIFFFFLQCSTIRDLVISDFLWSHCCNVIVFRNLLGEVIARLQSHFGFHTYKMRMLHLQRASRFTAEKQHETAFTYSLLTTPFSSSSNFQSQGH